MSNRLPSAFETPADSTDAIERRIKVFVSSPGDLSLERRRIAGLVARLNGEYAGFVRIETVMYEEQVYSSREGGFQAQIEKSSASDLVLAMFWGRLGTPLPETFPERQADGALYPSGTVYELTTAWEAQRSSGGGPEVFVFRKTADLVMPKKPDERREAVEQLARLDAFFAEHFQSPERGILRAHEPFERPDDLEAKIDKLLRKWILEHVRRGTTWPIETKGSPFRGLEPFDARHASVYFGRERKVRRAIEELKTAARRGSPFLLIPGASGAGKSSLMRAGLAPRIVRPGAVEGVDVWRTAVMRPGAAATPVAALCRALCAAGTADDDPGGFGPALPELLVGALRSPDDLTRLFQDSPALAVESVVAAIEAAGRKAAERLGAAEPLPARLLLLIDQFEEAFAAGSTDADPPHDAEQRRRFFDVVLRLLASGRVWIVTTLRGDMYERMITERPLIALKDNGGQFDLSPPSAEELEEIVHRSMEAAGLSFEQRDVADERGVVRKQRLLDLLLREASGENTLPLLQFTLDQLFRRCWEAGRSKVLTFAAYEAIGGIDGSIDRTAEEALFELAKAGRLDDVVGGAERQGRRSDGPASSDAAIADEVARSVNPVLESLLRRLVGQVVRDWDDEPRAERALAVRTVTYAAAHAGDVAAIRVIDALLAARVLTINEVEGRQLLRIAHDRVLSSWKRAQELIRRNRNFYRLFHSVEHACREWTAAGRSAEYLLAVGAPTAQAAELLRDYGAELPDDMRDFVRRSVARAQRRQRLAWLASGVFGLLAVVSAAAAVYAFQQRSVALVQERRATDNYTAARDTVERLVASISAKLRDADGISVGTIEDALTTIDGLVVNLSSQSGGDEEFDRILGDLHYEFAKVYQKAKPSRRESAAQAADPLQLALKEARIALQVRERLVQAGSDSVERRLDLADSLDQEGDVLRELARRAAPKDEEESRALYDRAFEVFERSRVERERLLAAAPDEPRLRHALSQSLARLGDLHDVRRRDRAASLARYEQALTLALQNVAVDSDDPLWRREFAFTLQKVAKMHGAADPRKGMLLQDLEVVARRLVHESEPTDTLWKQDLAWSLLRRCDACLAAERLQDAEEAVFDAIVLREELVAGDRLQRLWSIELSDAYRKAADLLVRRERTAAAAGLLERAVAERAGDGDQERPTIELLQNRRREILARLAVDQAAQTDELEKLCVESAERELDVARQRMRAGWNRRLEQAIARWNRLVGRLRQATAGPEHAAVYRFVEDEAGESSPGRGS